MKKNKILLLVLMVLLIFTLISCESDAKKYTIKIYDDKNNLIEEIKTNDSNYLEILENYQIPEKSDYEFLKWNIEISDSAIIATIVYVKSIYQVKFYDTNNKFLNEVPVSSNKILNIPNNIFKLGYKTLFYYNNALINIEEFEVIKNIDLIVDYEIEKFELPIVNITLDNTQLKDVNKVDYVSGKFSLINLENEFIDLDLNFRGRGHGSWEYDKKGYKLKLDKKTELFGLPKSKHWVLVANGHDDSMMRHNIAYQLVNDNLSYIDYTTDVNIVDLYINGNYHGVYSLFEHNRVEKGRVEIESNYHDLETGFYLEYDAYANESGPENINWFKVEGLKYPFELKSPDPDDYLEEGMTRDEFREQVLAIKNYMQTFVDTVLNKDYETFKLIADENSFIDMYLIHEFMKNTDTGWSSFYYAKDKGGKLKLTSAWDFDLSSGITRGDQSYEGLYVSDRVSWASDFTQNEIFTKLLEIPEFKQKVKSRYLEVHEGFIETINNTFNLISTYSSSYERDGLRWKKTLYYTQTEQTKLKNWLLNRADWMRVWALKQ